MVTQKVWIVPSTYLLHILTENKWQSVCWIGWSCRVQCFCVFSSLSAPECWTPYQPPGQILVLIQTEPFPTHRTAGVTTCAPMGHQLWSTVPTIGFLMRSRNIVWWNTSVSLSARKVGNNIKVFLLTVWNPLSFNHCGPSGRGRRSLPCHRWV